ncbi:MAG TPA: exodeoxyribonuclease VII large subunit [Syntrophorhabdales bacterium]|nr:exodeoxyribonuclease VII large subunit [Syntrophorhabdales bacterium]
MQQAGAWPIHLYTVSQLTSRIRESLHKQFRGILVEGEISNFKLYPSGHLYFTLKDESSSLRAIMFNFQGKYPEGFIKDGAAVICSGRIDVYEKRGEYRLLVDELEVRGLGLLQLQFQILKEKLFKEGLFDESRKRPLPLLPFKIGIVTSPAGAAIRDMLKVISQKYENMTVLIYPVRVQGDGAGLEIAEGIRCFNEHKEVDVIIVGRGGGSLEDLACFNEECVARAIHASEIPVISAVGHEIDFTIADFVADLRAPTPTAAAEMVVRNKQELLASLLACEQKLESCIRKRLEKNRLLLYQSFAELRERKDLFTKHRIYVDELSSALVRSVAAILDQKRTRLNGTAQRLDDLNPESILKRGYSITVNKATKEVIKESSQLLPKDKVQIKLYKGEIDAVVSKTTPPESA